MHSVTLPQAVKMLPTPLTTDYKGTAPADSRRNSPPMRAARYFDFAQYQPAIERWEKVLGRKAPAPTVNDKLNPAFTEFMMGLPEGWVTDVEITWEQQIKACGNGVVPQQAKLALERLIP
jgi:DNA (cytosine-5)-methyltransferase 1